MVTDHGRPWFAMVMFHHDFVLWCQLPKHGQPWSTMVDHGQQTGISPGLEMPMQNSYNNFIQISSIWIQINDNPLECRGTASLIHRKGHIRGS
jgi:hypothetical protein